MDDVTQWRVCNGRGARISRAPQSVVVPAPIVPDVTTPVQGAGGERRAMWLASGVLALGLLALGTASLVSDVAPGQYIVIAAPFTTAPSTVSLVAAAGGALLSPGGLANIVIAHSDDPDFAADARAAGAWAVLPAPRALGCVSPSIETLAVLFGGTTQTTGTAG